jgi:hypothetical protein
MAHGLEWRGTLGGALGGDSQTVEQWRLYMLGAKCLMILPIIVGWMATYDGGEPAKSKESPPTLTAPSSAKPAAPAPKNALVPVLPECSPSRNARPVQRANERLIGKRVALRGVLTFGLWWSCRCKECQTTWIIVDPTARVLDDSTISIEISQSGQTLRFVNGQPVPWVVVARGAFPDPPDIDVIASGVLREKGAGKDFLLEDAKLCRVKLHPNSRKEPLVHSPAKVSRYKVRCSEGLDGLLL